MLLISLLFITVSCGDQRRESSGEESKKISTEIEPGSLGSAERPLNVMLVPTDGGTEAGTRADFSPIFNAVSRSTGLQFNIRVGQSYSSVIEGLANKLVDIAFVGPVTYMQAYERQAAEPLAVAVLDGESVYYAGIFAQPGFILENLSALRGKRMAFGDVNSSTSFTFQVAMLMEAGLDPASDLDRVYLTGGHTNSLNALRQGHVDVAAASLNVYQKGINEGAFSDNEIIPVAVSNPVPYPPFVMHPSLPDDLKNKLRHGFNTVHKDPNITPDMIRGFGGILVDRYTSDISHEDFSKVAEQMEMVSNEVKRAMLRKASER